jgi:hypothetical protein
MVLACIILAVSFLLYAFAHKENKISGEGTGVGESLVAE